MASPYLTAAGGLGPAAPSPSPARHARRSPGGLTDQSRDADSEPKLKHFFLNWHYYIECSRTWISPTLTASRPAIRACRIRPDCTVT
jgi:hypothetical protein